MTFITTDIPGVPNQSNPHGIYTETRPIARAQSHGSTNLLFIFCLAFHCLPVPTGCEFWGIFKAKSER